MKQFPWQRNCKPFAGLVGMLAIGLIGGGCASWQRRPSSYLFYKSCRNCWCKCSRLYVLLDS
jgi:hypothetical protein